mgnify:CR=1 FL=1
MIGSAKGCTARADDKFRRFDYDPRRLPSYLLPTDIAVQIYSLSLEVEETYLVLMATPGRGSKVRTFLAAIGLDVVGLPSGGWIAYPYIIRYSIYSGKDYWSAI